MSRFVALGAVGLTVALGAGCGGGDTGVGDFTGSSDGGSCLVPESELVSGGPGRDGIPALDNPVVVSADEGDQMYAPSALVLGVTEGGEARAYPHAILWWHEIANDVLGGVPVVVSSEGAAQKAYPYGLLGERSAFNEVVGGRPIVVVYDRQAELAVAFDRRAGGETFTFRIADGGGFPFRLRDEQTGSDWTLDGRAVGGPLLGSRIEPIATYSALPEDGHEVILALLHKGEVFGEEAVLEDAPRDHMAEAYDDALICIITRKDFLDMLRTFPDLTFRVTKLIGFRLKTFRNRVEGLLFKGTAARLAQTLVDLARDHGVRDDHGVVLPLRLSQTDLANLIGVTRESVNQTLADFRKRGLVELDGRTLRLLQPEALAQIAHGARESDPSS